MSGIEEVRAQIQDAINDEGGAIEQSKEAYTEWLTGAQRAIAAASKMREVIADLHAVDTHFKHAARIYSGAGALALQATEKLDAALSGSTTEAANDAREGFKITHEVLELFAKSTRHMNDVRGALQDAGTVYSDALTEQTDDMGIDLGEANIMGIALPAAIVYAEKVLREV